MIRYYKLFDLLNRRDMTISDLRKIISSATVAKLRKGEYISGEVIEKICLFLECQPGDIMEVVEVVEPLDDNNIMISRKSSPEEYNGLIIEDSFAEQYISNETHESDVNNTTQRTKIHSEIL